MRHSSIILLDFDHVEDIARLASVCEADPHTVFSFRSPTDGYKVGVYVKGAEGNHQKAFNLVAAYYEKLTGLKCDPACKDESRLCYVNYDEKMYVATLYRIYDLRLESHPNAEKQENLLPNVVPMVNP